MVYTSHDSIYKICQWRKRNNVWLVNRNIFYKILNHETAMEYRIIEKYYNSRKVIICEHGDGGYWRHMNTDKRETWYSTQYVPATFNTYEEAEAFINSRRATEPKIHYL